MANLSLTLYTNAFFGSILKSPMQMGSLSVNNSVTNISRWGTFKFGPDICRFVSFSVWAECSCLRLSMQIQYCFLCFLIICWHWSKKTVVFKVNKFAFFSYKAIVVMQSCITQSVYVRDIDKDLRPFKLVSIHLLASCCSIVYCTAAGCLRNSRNGCRVAQYSLLARAPP